MLSIYQLVKEILQLGYLSVDTENQISSMFNSCLSIQDIEALITLQDAVAFGYVKREAHTITQVRKAQELAALGSK